MSPYINHTRATSTQTIIAKIQKRPDLAAPNATRTL